MQFCSYPSTSGHLSSTLLVLVPFQMLYGYDCPASDQHNETEEDLELDDMALAPVVESSFLSTPAPSMTTPWLMVEGVELGRKGRSTLCGLGRYGVVGDF